MHPSSQFRLSLPEQLVALGALGLVLFYIYIQFIQMPYIGFDISRNRVTDVNVPGDLKLGDEILQFGNTSMSRFYADWRMQLLDDLQPGSLIPLVIRRDGLTRTVQWVVPGITPSEFISRLSNQWWLALVFAFMGLLTLLGVRPKDDRWRLLVAFNYLTALWLSAGCVSRWHLGASAAVLSSAMWLCLPVYLHLHWIFPQPLRPVSPWVWRGFYALTVLPILASLANLVSINSPSLAVALGALGALILMIVRFVFRPAQRRETGLLLVGGCLTFVPPIILGTLNGLFIPPPYEIDFSLLGLPALPLLYFYVAYRRQLGNFELRANRLLGAYVFFLLLALGVSLALSALQARLGRTTIEGTTGLLITLAVTLFSLVSLSPFQRFVDGRLLGISIPPQSVIEVYTNRLATSLNTQAIVKLLTREILPSLLVHQSTLFRLTSGQLIPVYAVEVESAQMPTVDQARHWPLPLGRYLPPGSTAGALAWVRLALPIVIEDNQVGLWLFGHHDPDDFYGQDVIQTLQSLASQTAIALTNITQAEQLLTLNQIHIEQYESERVHIARELHDEVLNDLSPLADGSQPASSLSPERAALIAARIRNVISGLRPLSLHYGLYYGLQALFDELEERHGQVCHFKFEVNGESARYLPTVELHLYRIIQQACDNGLKHGQPAHLSLRGNLLEDAVSLIVEDDGRGFASAVNLDLANLLAAKHFGIAGMLERAGIIGASLAIHSMPDGGTRLELRWPQP